MNKNVIKVYTLLNRIFRYVKLCKILRIRNFEDGKYEEYYQFKHEIKSLWKCNLK